jgi:hypothetical protein
VIGTVTVSPVGFIAFLAGIIWVLVVSALLYLRGAKAGDAASRATPRRAGYVGHRSGTLGASAPPP